MISHVFIGVTDFARANAFYAAVLAQLDLVCKFCDHDKPWAAWMSADAPRPLLLIGHPFNGAAHTPGNGGMVALLAPSRAAVDNSHAAALTLGAVCEGAPGLRPQYHDSYYGAYVRDLDGNKIAVVCHQ